MEERLLVKRAKRGDVDAFAELYGQIYQKLYQFALYTLKDPEDAKDAVSAAVTDAFESIGKLRKEEAFSGWMEKEWHHEKQKNSLCSETYTESA